MEGGMCVPVYFWAVLLRLSLNRHLLQAYVSGGGAGVALFGMSQGCRGARGGRVHAASHSPPGAAGCEGDTRALYQGVEQRRLGQKSQAGGGTGGAPPPPPPPR